FETYYQETSKMDSNILVDVLKENMTFHIPEEFSKSKAKVLVTVGAGERKIMKQSAMDVITRHRSCKGVVIPNVGHGVSLSQPDLFNKMVDAWIHDIELPSSLIRMVVGE